MFFWARLKIILRLSTSAANSVAAGFGRNAEGQWVDGVGRHTVDEEALSPSLGQQPFWRRQAQDEQEDCKGTTYEGDHLIGEERKKKHV